MKKGWVVWGRLLIITVFCCADSAVVWAPGAYQKCLYPLLIKKLKFGAHRRTVTPFVQVFFPPQDKVERLVCELIEEEPKQIDITAFQLTNKKVAQAIINAHHRSINIRIVADVSTLGRFNKVREIADEGVPVFIYPKAGISENSLMHNKIILLHGLGTIVTGSMNLTKAGMESNEENLLIMQYQPLFDEYARHFNYLITRAQLFSYAHA